MIKDDLFLSESHKERYEALLEKDGTKENDIEREVFFYIIAGAGFERMGLYDFEEHMLSDKTTKMLKGNPLSSGENQVFRLAVKLYGQGSKPVDVFDLFSSLDKKLKNLCINAIMIRFRMV